MKRINYKSDFDFQLRLRDGRGNEVGWPEYDWSARLWTASRANCFEASCVGGVCVNCYNDNGRIHIVCNDVGLSPGRLQCEFRAILPDETYPDSNQVVVTPEALDIVLVIGAGDLPAELEAEAMLPYIKGDAFTYSDLTEEEKSDLRAPVLEKVDSVEMELKTHVEDSGRKFIGVWDEMDNIRELLASVNSREVHTLLGKLGFTESDIEEYIFANLHLDLGLTIEALRESAWRWEHFDELDKPVPFPVLPKMSLELEEQFGGFGNFLKDVDLDSVKYLPQIEMSYYYGYFWDDFRLDRCFRYAVYHGGINHSNQGVYTFDWSFNSSNLKGIGMIEGNISEIKNGNLPNLRYIKGIRVAPRGGTFDISDGFVDAYNLSNAVGVQIPRRAKANKAFWKVGYQPLVALRIGNWDFDGLDSASDMFYNRLLKNESFEFAFSDFSHMQFQKANSSPYNLFNKAILDSCTIRLPNAESENWSENLDRFGKSIRGSGPNRIIAPKLRYVDMSPFYSFGVKEDSHPAGIFVIECPEACNFSIDSTSHHSVIPAMIGKNIPDNTTIRIEWAVGYSLDLGKAERREQLIECMNKALDTWYDRQSAGLGTVTITIAKWQHNLLDKDVILGLQNKGYTISII